MRFEDLLKQIDNYFENITQEQLEQDLKDIGIDEIYEYIKQDESLEDNTLYFENDIEYVYNKEIKYNIFQKEGTRCQTKLKNQNKQMGTMALAS